MAPTKTILVDCELGRALGCETFCCRLVVPLDPGESDPSRPDAVGKACVDKTPDGRCACLEPASGRCSEWPRRPRVCREYDCNTDPLLQVVLRDGYRSLVELVQAPPVPGHERMLIPAIEKLGVEPGEGRGPAHELVRLRRRLEAEPRPDRCSEAEVACAVQMQRLHMEIARALGDVECCASCARGEPLPVGRFDGGRCCCHPVDVLFDDATLGGLAAAGVTPRDLRGPYQADSGCVFRGPGGCVIPPAHRPDACVGYVCDLLEAELQQRGDLPVVSELCRRLEEAATRFARLRAVRRLSEALADLL